MIGVSHECHPKPPGSLDANNSAVDTALNTLIDSLKQGDIASFDKVFVKYYRKTLGFVNSLVKRKKDAEDITGDVFVSLWTNREKLDPSGNFNAHLYSIARDAVLAHFRGAGSAGDHSERAQSASSDEAFLAKETELLVRIAVDRMPSQRQRVFTLSRDEGMSNDDISKLLGISRKTVEKRLRLALTEIKKVVAMFLLLLFHR